MAGGLPIPSTNEVQISLPWGQADGVEEKLSLASPSLTTAVPVVLPPNTRVNAADPLARAYELPCTLVLEVAVIDFNVGSLMHLQPGAIVRTAAQHNEDLSLKVNGQLVGAGEFDVIGEHLAIRLTGMA